MDDETNDKPVEVRFEGETVWLNQEHMSGLFGRERSVISKHIRNVFKEGERDAEAACAKFAHAATDGKPPLYGAIVAASTFASPFNTKSRDECPTWIG